MLPVLPGIAVLAAQGFSPLRGLRVGIVTNPTGVLPDGKTSTVDALSRADGVRLVALFGPEHGVRGDVPAGKYIASYTDKRTGLPAYSLYGKTKSPTASMLKGIDVLLFDIQDIGCRSYTYLSTLGAVLDGAGKHGVSVIVCDRPNPLGGIRVEGRPVEPGYTSFVSRYPVAYRHGLTMGELAKLLTRRGYVHKVDLSVIPCENLSREQSGWESFGGLPWIPTSPNIPTPDAAILYAVTGIIGELPSVSIGIGTDAPFGYCGSPKINADKLIAILNDYNLPGVSFTKAQWVPRKGAFRGDLCHGARIRITDMTTAELCRVNFALLSAFRITTPNIPLFHKKSLFDAVCGTDTVRKVFLAGATEPEIWAEFQRGAATFAESRKPYFLY